MSDTSPPCLQSTNAERLKFFQRTSLENDISKSGVASPMIVSTVVAFSAQPLRTTSSASQRVRLPQIAVIEPAGMPAAPQLPSVASVGLPAELRPGQYARARPNAAPKPELVMNAGTGNSVILPSNVKNVARDVQSRSRCRIGDTVKPNSHPAVSIVPA